MRERMEKLGGSLEVSSSAGSDTLISAVLPFSDPVQM
jgi:signal transduction histidine kinase